MGITGKGRQTKCAHFRLATPLVVPAVARRRSGCKCVSTRSGLAEAIGNACTGEGFIRLAGAVRVQDFLIFWVAAKTINKACGTESQLDNECFR